MLLTAARTIAGILQHTAVVLAIDSTANHVQAGMIVDNELNRLLVNPLPSGVRLHAIIDACHSGSMLDLECRAEFKRGFANWQNEYRRRPKVYKVIDTLLRLFLLPGTLLYLSIILHVPSLLDACTFATFCSAATCHLNADHL